MDKIKIVVNDFRKTKIYSEEFLKDLEQGLRKSSYLNKDKHEQNQKIFSL